MIRLKEIKVVFTPKACDKNLNFLSLDNSSAAQAEFQALPVTLLSDSSNSDIIPFVFEFEPITSVRVKKTENITLICWFLKSGHLNKTNACAHTRTHKHMLSHLVQTDWPGAFNKSADHAK